jgi:hypothetical protein
MLRLDLRREPFWLDLGHGVRLRVRPCTTALMMAARAAAAKADAGEGEGTAGARTAALLAALARFAAIEWDGVGDDDGNAAPLTPEGIEALLSLWPMAEAFERLYLAPALLLDSEKNG